MTEAERLALLKAELAAAGPPPPEPMSVLRAATPGKPWSEWTPARALIYLRQRFGWSQRELGRIAGLSQAQISRLEGGADATLSTWKRVYEAMGFSVFLLPTTGMTNRELYDRAEAMCDPRRRNMFRARSRRAFRNMSSPA